MSPEMVSALSKLFGIMAVCLDQGGVVSRGTFAEMIRQNAKDCTGTEAAFLAGLANGIAVSNQPVLTVIEGGRPFEPQS
jgi:nicotinamide mononucleotide (NMN) deamidase PncC